MSYNRIKVHFIFLVKHISFFFPYYVFFSGRLKSNYSFMNTQYLF